MSDVEKVFLIDDEKDLTDSVGKVMLRAGYQFGYALTGREGLKKVREMLPDVVILDMVLPDTNGARVLTQLKEIEPDLPVIILTGHETVKDAVGTMKDGAYTYMAKPFSNDELEITVRHAIDTWCMIKELRFLRVRVHSVLAERGLFTTSDAMKKVARLIESVAQTDATVLLTGESGTGKELIANAIHKGSPRSGRPFVTVDLTACPETLVEGELFGHERGAFTGAHAARPGKVELANGGTLFLDEIGNLPSHIQVKLLRVLESRVVERIGGRRATPVDIRVVAATNKDLKKAVADGNFRLDLYHRLNEFPIELPPLRERIEDIPLLTDHFIQVFNKEMHKKVSGVSRNALKKLEIYPWPGNVRELKNTIKRCMVMASKVITAEDLPSEVRKITAEGIPVPTGRGLRESAKVVTQEVEKKLIREALESSGGKRAVAAKLLGVDEKTLYNKMKEYGIILGGGGRSY